MKFFISRLVLAFTLTVLLAVSAIAEARQLLDYHLEGQTLTLHSDDAVITLTFYGPETVVVDFQQADSLRLPSYAIAESPEQTLLTIHEHDKQLELSSPRLTVWIDKQPLRLHYVKDSRVIAEEADGFFLQQEQRGVRFKLADDEKLLGGGERVMGMDRRGQRMPLYNKAHYAYTTASEQMNFSLPAVMSSHKYMLLFDNSARGTLDIGKREPDILQFDAVAGRLSYAFVAGESYPKLIEHYVTLTGKQPMPPRWAFGNFASRFGYHSEREAREVVASYRKQDIPLDAIIFDLYWFGKDIQGYMGNLDWDRQAFPTPQRMIDDFNADGVNTLLITEPFVLTSASHWQSAVDNKALALAADGGVKTYDFYFGHTGLIDVFSANGQRWFADIYKRLMGQGLTAWWGDLGEPEVHPADTQHAVGTADEIHNVYGQQWAKLIFQQQQLLQPDTRPFLLMRSGFAGSQRYGMVPWTGDVSRSWGGLKPQVELSLQMGVFGLGYTHSDLGGFAGDNRDEELYRRWLQYGVFQPIYRPHAQEQVPSEPIYYQGKTQQIVRDFIKLRYALLPYNYTLAYQNAKSGMPLMRPLFFENEQDLALIDEASAYLWGDAFLVAPITQAGVNSKTINAPAGVWFDYFSGKRYQGGQRITLPVTDATLPVLVRAGAFVPMVKPVASTAQYSSQKLQLHYYADASVHAASYQMYEDDGKTLHAKDKGLYELLNFSVQQMPERLKLHLSRSITRGYPCMPNERELLLTLHHLKADSRYQGVWWQGVKLPWLSSEQALVQAEQGAWYDAERQQLQVKLRWQHQSADVVLR